MSAQASEKRPRSEPPRLRMSAAGRGSWKGATPILPEGTPGPRGQTLSQLLLVAPLLLSARKVGLRFPSASPVSPSLLPPGRWEEPGFNKRRWPRPRGFPSQGVKDQGKVPLGTRRWLGKAPCWNCSRITRFVWLRDRIAFLLTSSPKA